MKVVFTSVSSFPSKDKSQTYQKLQGLNEKGEHVEVFLNQEQQAKYPVTSKAILTAEQLGELFDNSPVVEVQFDQRGRLSSLEA